MISAAHTEPEYKASCVDICSRMIHNFLFCAVFMTLCFCQNEVKHIVMNLDGTSVVGLIDSMDTDSVYIAPEDTLQQQSILLDDVYYIYNSLGKLYYISPNYKDRLGLIEERSGSLVTVEGDTLNYSAIEIDRKMDEPYVYLQTEESELGHKLSLFDVHLIRIDASYMEHSVRRGTITGLCVVITGIGLQTLSNYGDRSDNLPEDATFMNKLVAIGGALGTSIVNFIPQGNQYQSVTIIFPLSTISWMIYDYMYDKRTHYFRPLIREDSFPHSMYWFNPVRIVKNKINETMEPVVAKIRTIF